MKPTLGPFVLALALSPLGCVHGSAQPSRTTPVPGAIRTDAADLVVESASCWLGGLWSDALDERGKERQDGIDARCNAVLRDARLANDSSDEPSRVVHVTTPPAYDSYYPLRAVEPVVVDAIGREVRARAERDSSEAPYADELTDLLRAVADAARENVDARRAADGVKNDPAAGSALADRTADKVAAGDDVRARKGLDALFGIRSGPYAETARALALLFALDRVEIASGLPKHLKIDTVAGPFADVFGVHAPEVSHDPSAPIPTGTWLAYLTHVAAAAGHAVPSDAHDPQNREPLAWTGMLEGFADQLRAATETTPARARLGDVERGIVSRLDAELRMERVVYTAHPLPDR